MADTKKRLVVPIYQLKVTLGGSKPPIWRRIQVTGEVSLGKLHHILQAAMGWYDCHLHQFEVGGISYSDPDQDYGLHMRNERIMSRGRRFDEMGIACMSFAKGLMSG